MNGPSPAAVPHPPEGRRRRVASGVIVNSGFTAFLSALGMLKGFIIAAFLTPSQYGVWGVVAALYLTLLTFRTFGIRDNYVRQQEEDQELALAHAQTVQLVLACVLMVLGAVAIPLLANAYDVPEAIAPSFVIIASLPASALAFSNAFYYRSLDFMRQRRLEAWDPIVSFVVSVALAIGGAGYWSLVIGGAAGTWAGAIAALRASPFRLRLAWDTEVAKGYFKFSWPIFVAGTTAIVYTQVLIGVGEAEVGIAGLGAIALTGTVAQFARRADDVITTTLYPAICAVKDRADLMREALHTSNLLTLLWAAPFGIALGIFGDDLELLGLGEKWEIAGELMAWTGIAVALHQVGFNWDAFYRAREQTVPVAIAALWSTGAFLGISLPLMLSDGLHGLAISLVLVELVAMAVRGYYLRKMFGRVGLLGLSLRGFAPSLAAAAVVIGLRAAWDGDQSTPAVVGELLLYIALAAGLTWLRERSTVREMAGYLRRRPAAAAG